MKAWPVVVAAIVLASAPAAAFAQEAGGEDVAVEYPDGLVNEIVSDGELLLDEPIPPVQGEKLGVVISSHREKVVAVSVARLRILGIAPEGVVIGGRSVYARGKARLSDGEEVAITNSAFQNIERLNQRLGELTSFRGEFVQERLRPLSSCRVCNVSDNAVFFKMRDYRESFTVDNFGAYLKPGDTLWGKSGDRLHGIGAAPAARKTAIEAGKDGYKAIISAEGSLATASSP